MYNVYTAGETVERLLDKDIITNFIFNKLFNNCRPFYCEVLVINRLVLLQVLMIMSAVLS